MNKESSHKQIIKSTGIIGGAQVITIIIGIIQTKIVAMLIGPAGIGIRSLYRSTLDLIRVATGMGLDFSAVREVAEANGTNDEMFISRTITILRRWVWFTGLLGFVLTLILAPLISLWTFGDEKYTLGIVFLSITLLISALSKGQMALLQGLRRIKILAKVHIYGAIAGFCISVALYWIYGINGIVPALILFSVSSLTFSWWFAKKVKTKPVEITIKETVKGGVKMVSLGVVMVITGLVAMGVMYLIRIFITKKMGVEGVGYFEAAWRLSKYYISIVMAAMATDFFPRLSGVNKDNIVVNQFVNEQIEVGLLITAPLIIVMITFVRLILNILYTPEFSVATVILQWTLPATLFSLIIWPLGMIVVAKAKGHLYIIGEIIGNGSFLLIIYLGWVKFNLEIVGIAIFVSYSISLLVSFIFAKKLSNFIWFKQTIKSIINVGLFTILAVCNSKYISAPLNYISGAIIIFVATMYSFNKLKKMIDIKAIFLKYFQRNK